MSRKFIYFLIAIALVSTVAIRLYLHLFPLESKKTPPLKTVAITQIIQHPSLDKIRTGIIDELEKSGFRDGQTLEILYQNAQGNLGTAAQIAKSFVSQNPDVIVAITTPSAQTILSMAKNTSIPIVYGAVTDPVGAKLITSLNTPNRQVTGTVDLPPVDRQIALILRLFPHIKTLGVIYNPGEANNAYQIQSIKVAAQKKGLTVMESTASKSADVVNAAHYILKKVEAILLPNDNTVISAIGAITKLANEQKIPVFTSDPESIHRGALAAVANDQYQVGRQTGQLVVQILHGKTPATLPSEKVTGAQEYINQKLLQTFQQTD